MADEAITEKDLKAQEWKYYFVLIAWPLYLLSLFFVYSRIGLWSIFYMIFPGLYLFTWLGYLMHESWHKYVPGVNNQFFYFVFSIMLLTDPQVYRVLHGYHHSMVNTYEDNEFHPFGRIKRRFIRAVHNLSEIVFGIAYLSIAAQIIMPRHPKYGKRYHPGETILALFIILVFVSALGASAMLAFRISLGQVVVPFLVSLWLNSFFIHQSQLVEHGNLIAEGTWDRRNVLTRNLTPSGPVERLFLLMTHGDSREHVLHHTKVMVHSRPFPGRIPLPEGAVEVRFRDYLRVLGEMASGKETILH